jgi:HAD superfamily hydrolase (TIGR01549 family)
VADGSFRALPARDPAYPGALLAFCTRRGISIVIPTNDTELLALATAREAFAEQRVHIIISDAEFIRDCRDKRRTAIDLGDGARELLDRLHELNVPMGLMTDGRSTTQRHKVEALGLHPYLSDVLISEEFGSEKPDPRNYRFFADKYPQRRFIFIGDNTRKDFIVPAQLGWTTICLKCSGWNIHPQDFSARPRPDYIVASMREICLIHSSAAS